MIELRVMVYAQGRGQTVHYEFDMTERLMGLPSQLQEVSWFVMYWVLRVVRCDGQSWVSLWPVLNIGRPCVDSAFPFAFSDGDVGIFICCCLMGRLSGLVDG
jgi:hypothetical protein